ncbi:Crp/Fnr family transcriptional regulator [Myroides sp. LJL116]
MTISKIIDQIYKMPPQSKQTLMNCIEQVSYPKGHILLRANYVEKNIYFIQKGIVRAYAPLEQQDVTFWFGEEGQAILSMRSYVESEKGYENIELLEDCELYEIQIATLTNLYNQDIHIANWGRRLAERELLKLESRLVSFELLSAKERYDEFIAKSPSLLQRVPLKYIASYLGITPVSLSRVRKKS